MPTREEQKEARRQEILMAALDLFIKKGFGGTRITDIAKAVNMSTGLLFHYFDSKEKLYEALIEMGISGPQAMMTMDSTDPLVFFQTVAETIFYYLKLNPFSAKMFVLMMQVTYQEPATEKIAQMAPQITNIQHTVKIIEKGQQLGQIKEGDPLALSMAFWGAIQGVAQTCAMADGLPVPEAKWVVDILRK